MIQAGLWELLPRSPSKTMEACVSQCLCNEPLQLELSTHQALDKIDTSIHPSSQTRTHLLSSALAACSPVVSVLASQAGGLNHSRVLPFVSTFHVFLLHSETLLSLRPSTLFSLFLSPIICFSPPPQSLLYPHIPSSVLDAPLQLILASSIPSV